MKNLLPAVSYLMILCSSLSYYYDLAVLDLFYYFAVIVFIGSSLVTSWLCILLLDRAEVEKLDKKEVLNKKLSSILENPSVPYSQAIALFLLIVFSANNDYFMVILIFFNLSIHAIVSDLIRRYVGDNA